MTQSRPTHADLANALRALSMDAVERARSGHPGLPMGMADVATVLFLRHLRFDPNAPGWFDRDRFVHSAGHGSMLLYAALHLLGYPDFTLDELRNFRQLGSRTAGHPEYGHGGGIETTTGPLGQGIATAVGMALAERHLAAEFGPDLVDHFTYVLASDGDLMEGISHEACSLAGHLRLNKLIVLYDDNGISIDGPTTLTFTDDTLARFGAYGWAAERVDGHDPEAVHAAIERAKGADRPSLIACRTTIGFGAPKKAGTAAAHGAPLGPEEVAAAREKLGWPYAPFEIPTEIYEVWRQAAGRGVEAHEGWKRRLAAMEAARRAEFQRRLEGALPEGLDTVVREFERRVLSERPNWATRKSGNEVLKVLTAAVPELVGGSADLAASNLTNTPSTPQLEPPGYAGRHVAYGVREHAMVAAMNGMSLHGGIVPYGGTFLIFSDYCRPAIRLAALMRRRLVLVATHDSIGLGEDGPTHQPIEHLASLRAMPDLLVFRPCDPVETAECWRAALAADRPSVMALSRQEVPTLRDGEPGRGLAARGGYVLAEAKGPRRATILATGTEVAIAIDARDLLRSRGIEAAVVSLPCFELFDEQEPAYRASVLGSAPRVAVEAASRFGWTRYVASEDNVIGMRGFGASGPYKALYAHFGITPEAVAEKVLSLL